MNVCARLAGTISVLVIAIVVQACGGESSAREDDAGPPQILGLAAAAHHVCVLLSDRSASCWGYLGASSSDWQSAPSAGSPSSVRGLNGAVALAGGDFFTCAVLSDATATCWGDDSFGELGSDLSVNPPFSPTPVPVPQLADVSAIAAGGEFACARHSSGTVDCWGSNSDGELGNGTNSSGAGPVPVYGIADAMGIAAGGTFACAVLSDGTVDCWGDTQLGELGTSMITQGCPGNYPMCGSSLVPVQVPGLTGVQALAAGQHFVCALQTGGTVACWGDDQYGEIGGAPQEMCGGLACSPTPTVVAGLDDVEAIAAGDEFACALISDGTVRCWGFNAYGQLGNGATADASAPIAVSGLAGAIAITASPDGDFACALTSNSVVECWGSDTSNELGTTAAADTCDGNPCSSVPVTMAW
jgi:alpha-tubulin suppressor-like RCC1 family protein